MTESCVHLLMCISVMGNRGVNYLIMTLGPANCISTIVLGQKWD